MRKMTEKQQEARDLRVTGRTLRSIAKELHVSLGSISLWTRNVKIPEHLLCERKQGQVDNLRDFRLTAGLTRSERCAKQRKIWEAEGRAKAKLHKDLLHTQGCMLYWAEGSKANNRNVVRLSNSDPEMVRLFMRFLRESLSIPNEKIKGRVHCYLNNGLTLKEVEDYWLGVSGTFPVNLRKAQVQESSSQKNHRVHPYGTWHIEVCSTQALQHIFGAIQEYGGFGRTEESW